MWASDNRTLFYSVEDEEQKRQYQLFRHIMGTPHAEDVLVYEETDERFNIGAGRTRDGKYSCWSRPATRPAKRSSSRPTRQRANGR